MSNDSSGDITCCLQSTWFYRRAPDGLDSGNPISISGVTEIKVAIHQPNHWPFLGFFHKIASADLFIHLDTAQFSDGDYHHRNRIRNANPQGYIWLTVPVEKQRRQLREIRIKNDTQIKKIAWNEYHRTMIDRLYHSAPGYGRHQEFLDHLYAQGWMHLVDLNLAIIDYLLRVFQIHTPCVKSSALSIEHEEDRKTLGDSKDREVPGQSVQPWVKRRATRNLVAYCQEVGADTYLSGPAGRNYLDISLFEDAEIAVEFQEFMHPVYPQTFSPFVKNLSALDYILNLDMNDSRQYAFKKIPVAADGMNQEGY